MTPLDRIDRRLLAALQDDARRPPASLADAAGVSVATVQRRLGRLRAEGVIAREIAVVDPAALGQPMTFVVMVEMERERPDRLDAFARAARAEAQVQQCYYVTGEADFCLICTAADMAGFEALTRRLLFSEPNVRRFRTSVVMGVRKAGLAIAVDED